MLRRDAERGHAECVEAWLGRAPGDLPRLTKLFQRALGVLWRRAAATLGGVTLAAIAERVFHDASRTHPALARLRLEPSGVRFDDFPARGLEEDGDPREVVRFVLVELLTVIGHLTGEILTPALHAELSRVALADPALEARTRDRRRGASETP